MIGLSSNWGLFSITVQWYSIGDDLKAGFIFLLVNREWRKMLPSFSRFWYISIRRQRTNQLHHHSPLTFPMASSPLMTRAMRTAAFARLRPQVRLPRRSFQSTSRLLQEQSSPLPPKKPLGAFRGGWVTWQLDYHFHNGHSNNGCRWQFSLSFALRISGSQEDAINRWSTGH